MIAERLNGIGEYYFSAKLGEIEKLRKEGVQVINLGIGSPDMPPHPEVIATLQAEAQKEDVHAYQSYKGSLVLRTAFASWYKDFYGVLLNPETEVLPLMGSKEGILHICMTYLDGGDQVLIPNPGYPAYNSAVQLAGGTIIHYELKESNDWTPDMEILEMMDTSRIKLMFLNYPHMPTGKVADKVTLERLVTFATRNNILLVHDNPYSFILNDNPCSLLEIPGAKAVAIELNSLSKSHNMAGWRIGVLCGSEQIINEVLRFKSNMDSGMFLPLQLAAAKALSLDKKWYSDLNAVYVMRRQKVYKMMALLGCRYASGQAGMFVWARIPEGYPDAYALSDAILQDCGIFITPGGIFGSEGNQYIRISLCSDQIILEEALKRLGKFMSVI